MEDINKKKIVVITGSFNPITKAHYKILSDAVSKVDAEKGLFVCTNADYLSRKTISKAKTRTKFILSEEIRRKMVESLNKDNPKLFFGGYELGGASPSTQKTLEKIQKEYKDYQVYFLCGADKLYSISKWRNIETVLQNLYLIAYCRSDIDANSIINNDPLLNKYRNHIILLPTTCDIEDISSTEVRNRYFNGEDYRDLMNEGPYNILSSIDPTFFKELTMNDIIKATIKYEGQFGGNIARCLVYKDNMKIFNNWNEAILGSRNELLNKTKNYKEPFVVNNNNNYNTVTDCFNMDCSDVTLKLIEEGYNPAILNLASNVKPCGGYSTGANAQEEALCYMSTLSQSLYQFYPNPKLKCFKDANVSHIPNVYPMDINYGGIYSPNVCFFRNNINEYYSYRDKIFKCSVITAASLSNRERNEWTDDESKYFNETGYLNDIGLEIEKNKIRTIYRIALANNHDSIVLGAFGCGVYNLKSDEVSALFNEVLHESEFNNKFKKIVFAIYEGKGSNRKLVGKDGKYKPFYDIFGK